MWRKRGQRCGGGEDRGVEEGRTGVWRTEVWRRGGQGRGGGEDRNTKEQEGTLGDDECVHYHDCSGGFTNAERSKLTKFYTINMCRLSYVNYTSVKNNFLRHCLLPIGCKNIEGQQTRKMKLWKNRR